MPSSYPRHPPKQNDARNEAIRALDTAVRLSRQYIATYGPTLGPEAIGVLPELEEARNRFERATAPADPLDAAGD